MITVTLTINKKSQSYSLPGVGGSISLPEVNNGDQLAASSDDGTLFDIAISGPDTGGATGVSSFGPFNFTQWGKYSLSQNHKKIAGSGTIVVTTSG